MTLQPPIPVLRIFDLALAKAFYVDWLGFRVDWEHRFEPGAPVYLQVAREPVVLHLSEHYGDGSPGVSVLVETEGIEDLHRELQGYRYYKPHIEETDWGSRVMKVLDPFGNRLTFTERKK